ncbi:MAG: GNAT family N-acetyltransferase [Rhodobacteraceae bacterium]|nr:GNAT family N-acetyltransferase [Paracoccaceae bacterium]
MTLTIRALTAADEAEWRVLWTGYLDYYETSVPEEVYVSSFARMLSGKDDEFHGMVAELDGKLVGLVHYLFHRHGWKIENVCYLQDLYTDPTVRGKSIGRALIEATYKAADEAGAPTVYWLTQDFNEAGRRLYNRVGQLTPFIKYTR